MKSLEEAMSAESVIAERRDMKPGEIAAETDRAINAVGEVLGGEWRLAHYAPGVFEYEPVQGLGDGVEFSLGDLARVSKAAATERVWVVFDRPGETVEGWYLDIGTIVIRVHTYDHDLKR